MLPYRDILLTVDYDRTLTGPDATIPERNLTAIREFMALGGAFTVNTGRSVPMYRSILSDIPVNAPLLLYNGSAAYDPARDEVSLCREIPLDLWQTLDTIHSFCPEVNLEIQGIHAHYSYAPNPQWDAFYDSLGCAHATGSRTADYGPFLKLSMFGSVEGPGVSQLFSGTADQLRRFDEIENWLRQTFAGKMEVFRSGARIIDMHAPGVSKNASGHALKASLGRKILICVGDGENDVSMLDGADFAYCPSDAVIASRYENVCECGKGAVADVIYKKIPQILGK